MKPVSPSASRASARELSRAGRLQRTDDRSRSVAMFARSLAAARVSRTTNCVTAERPGQTQRIRAHASQPDAAVVRHLGGRCG